MALRSPILSVLLLTTTAAPAATFTVTTSADSAGSTCGATCTLRQALTAAGNLAGTDTIAFNIPGAGPHRITLASALPGGSNVLIDGLTQPGAVANTHAHASNAVLKIILDGRSLTQTLLNGSNMTVRGLSVLGAANAVTLQVFGGAVQGCWLGVEPDAVTTVPHLVSVEVNTSASTTIGGTALADRNVLVASTAVALVFQTGATGTNTVRNNVIGLLPDGSTPAAVTQAINAIGALPGQTLANNTISCTGGLAVRNFGSAVLGNRFGTTTDGQGNPGCSTGNYLTVSNRAFVGNTFGHYATTAVSLASTVSGVVFQSNRIVGGTAVPFDLNGNGFSFNDGDDSDTGANGLQNYPVITESLRLDDDSVQLAGTLRSTPNTMFALEFFATPEVTRAASGSFALGNAERIATATIPVTTDGSGLASFGPMVVEFDGSGALGAVVGMASRLDSNGIAIETSEYGEARAVYAQATGDLVVTNTESSGPGSLFRALLEAEARPDGSGRDRVVFAIPGAGPHTLGLGVLPTLLLQGALEIDGYSQPGSQPNTANAGSNAQLRIVLAGAKLAVLNDNVLVRGLVLTGQSALLSLAGGAVEGSFIGVDVTGTMLASTAGNTAQIGCSGPCRIGGMQPDQRNVIGCPQQLASFNCVAIQSGGSSGGATIEGNLLGVNASGLSALVAPSDPGGSQVATAIQVARQFTTVRGNVIGGLVNGVRAIGFGNITIANNRIGVGSLDAANVGNARHGILVDSATAIISGNHIAFNGRDGVQIGPGAVLTTLIENTVRDNGELGVDLNISGAGVFGDGVSANDPGDPDTLANGGQNYPVLANARRSASGVQAEITLDSLPNRQYRLRYCYQGAGDASGHGECEQPIAGVAQTVSTDVNGRFSGLTPMLPPTSLARLTVTAGRIQGSFEETSEFAANVAIADITTTSVISALPSPSIFGQPLTVAVSVAGVVGTPSGSVQISSSSGGGCTATLMAGSGSCAFEPGAAGVQTLTASYAGSSGFVASEGSTTHTVQRAPTTLAITSDTPDPSTFGDAITVNFSVASTPVTTGSVLVIDGVGGQCSGSLGVAGTGSCVLVPGAGGNLTLSASYAQTANFAASSDTEPHQVNAVASLLAILSDTPDPSVFGQPVAVSVQLSSSVGTPAGPIVVSDGAGASCQISGATGSCQLLPINVGNLTLRADFAGTPTHLQSTATVAHTVNRAATTLTPGTPLDSNGFPPRQFALTRFPVTVSAVAPGAGVPGGTVTVTGTPGVEVCVVNLPATHCGLVVQTPGQRTFQLQYAGDTRFLPSDGQISTFVLPDPLFANGLEGEDPR